MHKINLAEKLARFSTHWDPKIVARYNDNDIMVVKFAGEFPFHKHDTTDDFFLVLEGQVTMDYAGDCAAHPPVTFGPGEIVVVPKGVVHRPRAETEAKVLLIEPAGEPNTGDSGRAPAPKPMI
jgi:mannose-6-phosphate isomerase-like protein (cupin superfamily)